MTIKTNVMRLLDREKIKYKIYNYEDSGPISGLHVATSLGISPELMFKTLVTVGKSTSNYVFLLPVNKELDLKKASNLVGEKSISMIKSKDLLGLTGYIHGGCSPLGMKKTFKTIIHKSAKDHDVIIFNGGKIGFQVELRLEDLRKLLDFQFEDIVV